MIALDTNILLRYWVDDNPAQHRAATALINQQCSAVRPAFVSLVVLAEFAWVLQRMHRVGRDGLAEALLAMLDNAHLQVERKALVENVVQSFLLGRADFADYLIAAIGQAHGAEPTHTFDLAAGREPGFILEPI
jgi:predicted nucleic-acid-binding protein